MYICPGCGARIYGDAARYCVSCGEKLDASAWYEVDPEQSGNSYRSEGSSSRTPDDNDAQIPRAENRIDDARARNHTDVFGGGDSDGRYVYEGHLNDAGQNKPYGPDEKYTSSQAAAQEAGIPGGFTDGAGNRTDAYDTKTNVGGNEMGGGNVRNGENIADTAYTSGGGNGADTAYTSNHGNGPDTDHTSGGGNVAGRGDVSDGYHTDDDNTPGKTGKSKKKMISIIAAVLVGVLVLLLLGSALGSCSGSGSSSSGGDNDADALIGDESDESDDADDADDSDDADDDDSNAGSSGKTLLADELSLDASSGTTPDASSTTFQSLDDYADTYLDYDGPSENGTNIIYSMYGGSEAYDVIQEYVELLTDCMNFELVDSYEQNTKNTYFSYALEYTGTATVDVKNSMNFADDVYGDVTFWGSIEGDDLEVHMTVPNVLSAEDLGWRYGGTADISPKGDSVTAGLYQLSDGSYETTDGRLTTTLGSADVIVEGTETEGDAVYVITTDSKEELFIGGYYDEEEVYFTTGYENVETGDLYTLENLRGDNASMQQYDNPSAFALGTCFTIYHNGTWTYPLYSDDSMYNELSLRVMYYEENVVAVFYIYAELTTSPATIELLAAVDLSDAVADSDDSSGSGSGSINYDDDDDDDDTSALDCVFCDGTGECSNCGGDGYVYSYALGERDKVNCSKCSATGKCWYCSGTGKR